MFPTTLVLGLHTIAVYHTSYHLSVYHRYLPREVVLGLEWDMNAGVYLAGNCTPILPINSSDTLVLTY